MSPVSHLILSAALGAGLWLIFRSASMALACFVSGVLIDMDHLLDYVVNFGWRPRLQHFLRTFKHDILEYIIVFLHSWEFAPLTIIWAWASGWQPLPTGLAIGTIVHLALDQCFNRHSPGAYFLVYRIYHRFSGRCFYGRREYRERLKKQRFYRSPHSSN